MVRRHGNFHNRLGSSTSSFGTGRRRKTAKFHSGDVRQIRRMCYCLQSNYANVKIKSKLLTLHSGGAPFFFLRPRCFPSFSPPTSYYCTFHGFPLAKPELCIMCCCSLWNIFLDFLILEHWRVPLYIHKYSNFKVQWQQTCLVNWTHRKGVLTTTLSKLNEWENGQASKRSLWNEEKGRCCCLWVWPMCWNHAPAQPYLEPPKQTLMEKWFNQPSFLFLLNASYNCLDDYNDNNNNKKSTYYLRAENELFLVGRGETKIIYDKFDGIVLPK